VTAQKSITCLHILLQFLHKVHLDLLLNIMTVCKLAEIAKPVTLTTELLSLSRHSLI